jgi:hypothetical protein
MSKLCTVHIFFIFNTYKYVVDQLYLLPISIQNFLQSNCKLIAALLHFVFTAYKEEWWNRTRVFVEDLLTKILGDARWIVASVTGS